MKRTDWPVGQARARPTRDGGNCYYCDAKLGDQHAPDCEIRSRTVVVRLSLDMVIVVPEGSSREDVEFLFGPASGCFGSLVADADEIVGRLEEKGDCLDEYVSVEYLREATAEDEKRQGVEVAGVAS